MIAKLNQGTGFGGLVNYAGICCFHASFFPYHIID